MTIKVDSCELYSNNKAAIQAPQRSQTFRQPLPSREVDDIIEELKAKAGLNDFERAFVSIVEEVTV